MKKIVLPIGKRAEEIYVPEEKILYDIQGKTAPELRDVAAAVRDVLRKPIDSEPLASIVQPGDKVAIVVSDITRLVGTAEFLPVLVEELNAAGVADEDMTIVVATGTHRAQTPAEDRLVCGAEMAGRIRIHQHDSRNAAELRDYGVTSRGTPILVSKYVADADKIILTGACSLHPMAGFGGGRKALLPGVAGYASIMHNHAMNLAEKVGDGCNPACDTGLLAGNPMHEDMLEFCAKVQPDFILNSVFTPEGKLFEFVAGNWLTAWEKGCRDVLELAGVPIKEQADVVFASAGGAPKDINMYQSTKAHMNAVFAIKKGGILILTLDCPDIKEPAIFADWLDREDLLQMEKDVRQDYSVAAFVAFKMRCINQSLTVYMVTRPENFDFVRKSGQIPVATLAEAWELAQRTLAEQGKRDYTITIMSHAPATLPLLQQ